MRLRSAVLKLWVQATGTDLDPRQRQLFLSSPALPRLCLLYMLLGERSLAALASEVLASTGRLKLEDWRDAADLHAVSKRDRRQG